MGGRIRQRSRIRIAGAYSVEHCAFWLGDPRITTASPMAKLVFFHLGQIAVSEKRETLPRFWNYTTISQMVGVMSKTLKRCILELATNDLVKIEPDGRITVCGVASRHANLEWKDEAYIGVYGRAKKTEELEHMRTRENSNESRGAVDNRKTFSGLPPI